MTYGSPQDIAKNWLGATFSHLDSANVTEYHVTGYGITVTQDDIGCPPCPYGSAMADVLAMEWIKRCFGQLMKASIEHP